MTRVVEAFLDNAAKSDRDSNLAIVFRVCLNPPKTSEGARGIVNLGRGLLNAKGWDTGCKR